MWLEEDIDDVLACVVYFVAQFGSSGHQGASDSFSFTNLPRYLPTSYSSNEVWQAFCVGAYTVPDENEQRMSFKAGVGLTWSYLSRNCSAWRMFVDCCSNVLQHRFEQVGYMSKVVTIRSRGSQHWLVRSGLWILALFFGLHHRESQLLMHMISIFAL